MLILFEDFFDGRLVRVDSLPLLYLIGFILATDTCNYLTYSDGVCLLVK